MSERQVVVTEPQMIGIVGGVGPYAGLDLATKVFDQTIANSDQAHLPLALLSMPGEIPDRTAFLAGQTDVNPGYAIAEIIDKLEAMGATVVGIPCNTAHAPRIFDVIRAQLAARGSRVRLLNMIEEVAAYLATHHPHIQRVGLLCTTGTAHSGVYPKTLRAVGLNVLLPGPDLQEQVQAAIYDPAAGIKAQSHPVSRWARDQLLHAAGDLCGRGAQALVLGCTEIPLAIPEDQVAGRPVIDATLILARALIREVAADKLRPRSV